MDTGGKLKSDFAQRIRDLAEIRVDEPVVLSVYVNLDPSQFATAQTRQSQIESLMDEAGDLADEKSLSHQGRQAVAEEIERVKEWARSAMDPDDAHGIAVFCCAGAGVFEVFKLSTPVVPEVHIGRTARLEPLTAAVPKETWCVFLVNRRTDRVLRGSHDRLVEVASSEDDVHRQHDQGGWSQARYQRSVEKEVSDHVHNACERLFEAWRRSPFHKLLVGCPSELWPEVEAKLHPYLLERFVERFDAEVEHENPDEVLDRARPLIEREESRHEAELIERLSEQLGRGERAAAGLEAVLDALNAHRVEVLLLAPDFRAAGVICPLCGWMAQNGGECPADSTKLERVEDIAETAIRSAVLQSAAVREIRHHEPDRALSAPIAALLRF